MEEAEEEDNRTTNHNIKIEDIAIEEDEETHPGLASVKYLQSL